MVREFTEAGVVGVGTMGVGIVEVLARAGLTVRGVEVDEVAAAAARARLSASLERAVAGGKLAAEERDAVLGRVTIGSDLADLASVDLVTEAVPEVFALKAEVLAAVAGIVGPETVLATNTSTLSVTELAVASKRPARVVGLHWFNPAPVMKLVEVVKTPLVDADVVEDVAALAERAGKKAVVVGDRAGFVANALLYGYLNNAVGMLEATYASRDDIDAAMRFGCGHPMGPLALLDLIGLDSAYAILNALYNQTRDHLHAPSPLIKQLVTAGRLGRKTGHGFYRYAEPGSPTVVADPAAAEAGAPAAEPREVRTIGVVGTGTMASGIIEVCAKSGYQVVFRARGEDKVEAVRARVTASLDKAVARGKLAAEVRDEVLGRITGTTEIAGLADVDLVIEAVVEDLAVKKALFAELDAVVKPGAVLATTTSSLPVIECAMATTRPADVIGMHWFNPAQVMKLVEIVPTVLNTPDVVATVRAVCAKTKKHPVVCGDRAGFIVNALLFPYLNDAVRMLEEHYADIDEMDTVMTLGCGHPMGPFALIDVVGLDVTLAIQQTLFDEFREPGLAPAPSLGHLVEAGYLGRKTKRGFRDYAKR